MSQRVLVVSPDRIALNGTLRVLNGAGFDAVGASTFEEASRTITDVTPDLLIADERLGAFNGLHLVLRGRAVSADMRAIVTTHDANPMLESDARHLNAVCVVKPADAYDWLDPVNRILESPVRLSA